MQQHVGVSKVFSFVVHVKGYQLLLSFALVEIIEQLYLPLQHEEDLLCVISLLIENILLKDSHGLQEGQDRP
jgi:hypothetical protein